MNRNERVTQTIGTMALCAALLAATGAEALTLTYVGKVTRSTSNANLESSGITWTGGDSYYMVEDTATNLWKMTVPINRSTGAITGTVSCVSSTKIKNSYDMEGCAFDPCSKKVWISQETSALIREFAFGGDGTVARTAPVPAIQKQYYSNLSLESLTISGDGKTMWTANEEALKVDGDFSLLNSGTVVRLTKFVRSSVWDNWTAAGQWAYETQPVGGSDSTERTLSAHSRSGIADLCVLPDGTLLTMERRCYNESGFFPDFQISIYQVNFTGADDISTLTALKNASYKKVSKTRLWASSTSDSYYTQDLPNFEGMCLGPRLDDGSCVLVLIADGGSYGARDMMTFKLSGLNIRTMEFNGPVGCEPSGSPYRYVNGTSVTATLPGAGNLYYETNLVTHATWTLSGGRNGSGSTATFNVTADETFTWGGITNDTLPLLAADSFEGSNLLNKTASDLPGWSGGEDGYVAAKSYSPALPPGYPLNRETHTQVLEVDGNVTRTYDTSIVGGVILDTMIRATLPTPDTPVADNTDCFIAFHFDEQGHPMLQHGDRNGNAIRARARSGVGGNDPIRTVLSENTYTNGQWLRLTIKVDRPSGTWCHVSIDGSACVTSGGAYQPGSNPQMDGAWYRALSTNEVISAIELKGTGAVDDVTLFTATANDPNSEFPEFKVTDENGDRLPDADFYEWLNENGLPLDPNADVDGDTFTSLKEFLKGTDPWDKSSHPVIPTVFFGK